MKKYIFLDHTADIKIWASGKNFEEALKNIVLATSEYVTKSKKIKPSQKKSLSLENKDEKEMIYGLLDEIIYLIDVENFVTTKIQIKKQEKHFIITLFGNSTKKYVSINQIKAPTYSEMSISRKKDSCEITVVLDV